MFTQFFCLDCENSFSGTVGEEEKCPSCDSENIMEDRASINNDDWDDGHFEGDMHDQAPMNDRGDD